jgi:mannosyltransferase
MNSAPLADPRVIIPNLHWRFTGVTATNRMIAPELARLTGAVWFGADAPAGLRRLSFPALLRLWRRPAPAIWHARRNNEMIVGIVLRALGWPLLLLFTSAAQRHHAWLTKWLIARMDAVIATSPASASFLGREATVITHGVDAERFRPPSDRAAAFAAAGLPGKYAIGCFGRVRAQKGTDVFVAAMRRLLPLHPDFTAIIIGAVTPDQAAFAGRLKASIAEAGLENRVRVLGELPTDDVPRWYQRLTIYAFTSRNEGFGLTLIEAMASGAALVAARAGAADLVVEEGKTGVLVPAGDVEALVAALEPLMKDPRLAEAMGARGREKAVAEFSLAAEAERIAEVYRGMLSASTPATNASRSPPSN